MAECCQIELRLSAVALPMLGLDNFSRALAFELSSSSVFHYLFVLVISVDANRATTESFNSRRISKFTAK